MISIFYVVQDLHKCYVALKKAVWENFTEILVCGLFHSIIKLMKNRLLSQSSLCHQSQRLSSAMCISNLAVMLAMDLSSCSSNFNLSSSKSLSNLLFVGRSPVSLKEIKRPMLTKTLWKKSTSIHLIIMGRLGWWPHLSLWLAGPMMVRVDVWSGSNSNWKQ